MSTKLTTTPRNTTRRLNKPPLALRVKIPIESPHKGLEPHIKQESISTNMSCDTTIDESYSLGSKEVFSMSSLNLSHYLEQTIDNSDIKSMSSIDNHDNLEEVYITLNSALKQKKKQAMTDETKYKTEMCKNWTESGQCPYGRKCKFAHGKHELNEKLIKKRVSYKSQKCASFYTEMTCPYGIRCLFMHEQRTLRELLMKEFYSKYMSCPELLLNPSAQKKNRLPVFSYLAEEDKGDFKVSEGAQKQLNWDQKGMELSLKDPRSFDMKDCDFSKAFNRSLILIPEKRVC